DVRVHWDHPEHGPLDHAAVSAIAASSGLSPMLHRWMLIESIAELDRETAALGPVVFVVDVAENLLRADDFVPWLSHSLFAHGVPPSRLCLGIDDDVLAHDDAELV